MQHGMGRSQLTMTTVQALRCTRHVNLTEGNRMNHAMTPATTAHVVAALAHEGFWLNIVADESRYSRSLVEFCLDHDGSNPLVVVRCNLDEGSVVVSYGGQTVEVTSVHDNGSGPHLRSVGYEWSSEFFAVDHQDGVVRLNGRTIITPLGEERRRRDAEIEALKAQIPTTEKENEVLYI